MGALIMADNFLTQLLTNMQSQLERIEEKADESIKLASEAKSAAKDVAKRVSSLESEFSGRVEKKDMPSSPLHNPKVIQIAVYLTATILLIVAAIVGIDIRSLI